MFIVFPKSTAGYESFLVTALFLDILNTNWLPRSLRRALFCVTNEVDTSPNKPHLAPRLLAEFGNTLPQPPLAHRLFLQHLILSSPTSSPALLCLRADRTSPTTSHVQRGSGRQLLMLEGACLQPAHLLLARV